MLKKALTDAEVFFKALALLCFTDSTTQGDGRQMVIGCRDSVGNVLHFQH